MHEGLPRAMIKEVVELHFHNRKRREIINRPELTSLIRKRKRVIPYVCTKFFKILYNYT